MKHIILLFWMWEHWFIISYVYAYLILYNILHAICIFYCAFRDRPIYLKHKLYWFGLELQTPNWYFINTARSDQTVRFGLTDENQEQVKFCRITERPRLLQRCDYDGWKLAYRPAYIYVNLIKIEYPNMSRSYRIFQGVFLITSTHNFSFQIVAQRIRCDQTFLRVRLRRHRLSTKNCECRELINVWYLNLLRKNYRSAVS